MSDTSALRVRQWVSLPGGSCDVRIGTGVIDEAASVLKGAVGRPRCALLVVEEGVTDELEERLRRQLTDAGFTVSRTSVAQGEPARTLGAVDGLLSDFAEATLTADDLVLVVGGADALSLASYACAQWCGGMPLVMVPLGMTALVEATVSPRGIDVAGRAGVLRARPSVKHVLFDTEVSLPVEVGEDALMARVLMVATAMCDSEPAFSRLWDRADALVAGDREAVCEQLRDTIKTRGKILSSTALALRQSLSYGEAFARALQRLVGDGLAPSTARAEALRFQARLSCGEGMFEVDDVLAQDELLDRLELPQLVADVDPEALIAAVREERFVHSNRFLLGLPRKLGRVRLAAVNDELIADHVAAWCASRAIE